PWTASGSGVAWAPLPIGDLPARFRGRKMKAAHAAHEDNLGTVFLDATASPPTRQAGLSAPLTTSADEHSQARLQRLTGPRSIGFRVRVSSPSDEKTGRHGLRVRVCRPGVRHLHGRCRGSRRAGTDGSLLVAFQGDGFRVRRAGGAAAFVHRFTKTVSAPRNARRRLF